MVTAPNGLIQSSNLPLGEHTYGPVRTQLHAQYVRYLRSIYCHLFIISQFLAFRLYLQQGRVGLQNFPMTLQTLPRSTQFCHPSYAYGRQLDKSFYSNGGRPPLPPRPIDTAVTGPARELHLPPIASTWKENTCFGHGDPCLGAEQSGVSSIGFIDHRKWTNSKCC